MTDMPLVDAATFVEDAKAIMDKADNDRREKIRIQSELKQNEKASASLDKTIADQIATALKYKKEEVAASFNEEISLCQNKIKDAKTERAKAKADAIAEKIQRENAGFEQNNSEIQQKINQMYEENGIKPIFKNHFLAILFFPRKAKDWLSIAGLALCTLFLIPLFLILAMSKAPLTLSIVLFVYLSCLFGGYLYVLHHFMLAHQQVHLQAEQLKTEVKSNTKKMNAIAAGIRKSQDETGFNLGSYDDEIEKGEEELQSILDRRQQALDAFEQTTRAELTGEIIAQNKAETDEMAQQQEELKAQLQDAADKLEQTETEIRETYELRLGKELMTRTKLTALSEFCRENPELSLEQAIDCYKKTKK